ncbi:inversin isoform X2 [Fundulus heteroclitus]|uniref:inversin isoform X2 n=1 Tax=Fundulus heteroclitus TaxID=8078 RepID=UPI00165C8279|nr:inversin isoform X2 [Fundulus heteroclitus]
MASASSSPGSASPGSQVHAAAVNGDRSALVKLISAEPLLRDHEDQFGRTPLMYCVLADRLDCAEVLLKAGASVNKTDHSQRSALHLAAQKGNVRFLKLLLSRRANCLQKDLEGMTPLHLATRHPSPKALALLLKHIGPGEVDTQDKNKQTALHWSAFYNRPEHVRLLIKHDSNIGIPDSEGKIPLHWAAHSQEASATQTVRCILEAAPTESLLNWQDYEGRTPLHFAVADGNQAVVEVLTSYEGCNVTAYDNLFRTPLHWAALLGHAKIVHLLLERNTSGTIPSDSQGATPLHYGAQSNNAETVGVFLSHPSVKDEPDLEGRTAFMWAAGKGSDDVIRTMLALAPRIDINMADKYGGTALHAASLSGHVSTVRLLLEKGATVDSLDVMKHTPLFRACEMGYKDVILTLIKGSACVDLVDVDGHTALHWAALGGNAEVCQILMENGISPNVQDHAGRTPLQCAAYGGYITCMAVLMENNADPNIQDKEGRTALHWSCNNGYLDAVKLLLGYNAFPNQMEHTEERKREEGQRRRGAAQRVPEDGADRRRVSPSGAEQEELLLTNIVEGLNVNDSTLDAKNRAKIKEGRHKAQRSRLSRRSIAAERHAAPEALSCSSTLSDHAASEAPQHTKLKKLLSPAGSREPPSPRPTPHTAPRAGQRSSSVASAASTAVSPADRAEARPGEGRKKDSSRKHRSHKEPTSEAALRDRAQPPSLRSSSSSDPKRLRRRAQPEVTSTGTEEERVRRNEAARVLQRAWQRFCARRRREVRACEEAEPSKSSCTHGRKKMDNRAAPGKPASSKSSVLQSIYGNSMARRGRSLQGSQPHLLLDAPLRTQSQLGGLDFVHLTDALSQAKQFSYHLRPQSAGQGTRGRGKH